MELVVLAWAEKRWTHVVYIAGRSSAHLFCIGTTPLCVCDLHGAFAPATAGVLVAGASRERQLFRTCTAAFVVLEITVTPFFFQSRVVEMLSSLLERKREREKAE